MTRNARARRLVESIRGIEQAFLIGVDGVTEVWLVRHADCYANLSDHQDPGLSPLGLEQARRLSARIRRVGFAALCSSPARRAVETAGAISDGFKLDHRLQEFERDIDAVTKVALNPFVSYTEAPEQVVARMTAVVDDAVSDHPGERVVMVSHGGAILAYLCHVMRIEFGRLRLLPHYTSVNIVRASGNRRMVGALADTSHLEGATG